MNKAFEIRQARPDDADVLAEIAAQTFRDTFAPDNDDADMDSYVASSFSSQQISGELTEACTKFFLAFEHSSVIGYSKLKSGKAPDGVQGNSPLEIVRIYVVNKLVGRGYGAALMQACLDEAMRGNHDIIWLGVWESNLTAIRFYEKWGFRKVGQHDFVLGNDIQTDIIMARAVQKSQVR